MEKSNLINNNCHKEKFNELLFNKKRKNYKISLKKIYDNLYNEKLANLKSFINTDRTTSLQKNNKTNFSKIFAGENDITKKHLNTKNLVKNKKTESIPKKYSFVKTYFKNCSLSSNKVNDNINFINPKFSMISDRINDSSISLREKYRIMNLSSIKNSKKNVVRKSTGIKNTINGNKSKNIYKNNIKNNIFGLDFDGKLQFSEKKRDIFTRYFSNFTKSKNPFNKKNNKDQYRKSEQKKDIDDKSCQCRSNYNKFNIDLNSINIIYNLTGLRIINHSENKANIKKYPNINVGLLSELLKKKNMNISKL